MPIFVSKGRKEDYSADIIHADHDYFDEDGNEVKMWMHSSLRLDHFALSLEPILANKYDGVRIVEFES